MKMEQSGTYLPVKMEQSGTYLPVKMKEWYLHACEDGRVVPTCL